MRLHTVISLITLFTTAGAIACSSTNSGSSTTQDAGTSDATGGGVDGGGDAGSAGPLSFTPSNVDLSGIDLSTATDETSASNCEIRVGISSCFAHASPTTVTQSDGSKIAVYVVKSWKVEPTTHVFLSGIGGNMPIVIIALENMTIQGTIDGHAQDIHAAPGGFETVAQMAGSGPGGGPKGNDNVGAAGASYCGQGGQGAIVQNSGGMPAAAAAAAGNPEIVPLRGGASGGSGNGGQGGAGGAGFQLVAGGTFTMSAGSYINVGGGGGGYGATGGGGGAGGSILIEAQSASIAGTLAANGGGGAGTGVAADVGQNGSSDATHAAGGTGGGMGGAGSAGATVDGVDAPAPTQAGVAGGGGGGAGRIRINTKSGSATIAQATLSPAAPTPCVTQGTVK